MFSPAQLENILFIDIETASVTQNFDELNPRLQELWEKKSAILNRRSNEDEEPSDLFPQKAAIFAEFGKVVCISAGYLRFEEDKPTFRVKSWYGENESKILTEFTQMLDPFMSANPGRNLCAHNGKEFDFPYLGRRFVINQLPLPKTISDLQNKKPWEVRLLDTMTLWKFGDFKSYTSLDLLTAVLDIPSPKDDINGSEVGRVFWEENDYKRIADYCEKDVMATAQVMLRYCGQPLLEVDDMASV